MTSLSSEKMCGYLTAQSSGIWGFCFIMSTKVCYGFGDVSFVEKHRGNNSLTASVKLFTEEENQCT